MFLFQNNGTRSKCSARLLRVPEFLAQELGVNVNKADISGEKWNLAGKIDADGAKTLAEVLKVNTTVTHLDLGNNYISNDGVKAMAEALKANATITHLDLSWNDIDADGGKALAEAFKLNATVTNL